MPAALGQKRFGADEGVGEINGEEHGNAAPPRT